MITVKRRYQSVIVREFFLFRMQRISFDREEVLRNTIRKFAHGVCCVKSQIQVAIKCLSKERMQANPLDFLKEAAIMHGIDHEHIVRLYGVVLDTDALMLVRHHSFQPSGRILCEKIVIFNS
jgi:serine/threonine protein kinase